MKTWNQLVIGAALAAIVGSTTAPQPLNPSLTRPADATIDLATAAGVDLVQGQWRYRDTRIIKVGFKRAGPDGQPTGEAVKTYDYRPHAGGADFDDSAWKIINPTMLSQRRSTGRLCFNWYRIRLTIPNQIGAFDPTGSTVVFETSLDDYAEVWVDGELPRALGQSGGSIVAGWNAANRLVIGRDVQPGQEIQLAVFGANGPLSNPPTNFIWMRYARREFFGRVPSGAIALPTQEVNVEVERLDPKLDAIVPSNPKVFKLAEGFKFTEGPVWINDGYLLFSDPNTNRIYKYEPQAQRLSVFKERSGYIGLDIAEYSQPGSNGLTLDPQGRLTINEHGNRRVTRVEKDGHLTVLADRYHGKRLNSPNDLVYKSDGSLYFTDPPFGLPKAFADPRKETPYSGVYRWSEGKVTLLTRELSGPNGIAFSPDEKYLYVGNWDLERKVLMRYEVNADGSIANGKVFYDFTRDPEPVALDGIKVDQEGHVYVSAPGGVWILSPEGKAL